MKNLKFYLFALLALPVLTTSCDKDDDDDDNGGTITCKQTKGYIYDQTTQQIEDSVIYTYTGNQITKLESPGNSFVVLQYTGNYVTKRTMYDATAPTVASGYEEYTYNGDGTVQKIDYFEHVSGTNYAKWRTATATYTGGNYQKVTISEDDGTGSFSVIEEYVYTYTGENITTVVVNDYSSGAPPQTFNLGYGYDTNVNYIRKQNPLAMFNDPFFGEFDGSLLPLLVSKNNVTSITAMGMPVGTFSYQLDANGNLSKVNFSGKPLVSYAYTCQ